MANPDKPHRPKSPWVKAGIFGALGFEFIGFTLVGVLLGNWIDTKFDSEPFGLLVCLAISMMAAGLHLFTITKRFLSEEDD